MRISKTKEELIEQLRIKIREMGHSVREVASETGTSKTLIQNLLTTDPPKVSLDILLQIAKAYNVPFRFEHKEK